MRVKKINIKNLGQLSTYECEIEKDVLLVTQKDYADLLLGLSYASCNILFYMILEKDGINENTFIRGEFAFGSEKYEVVARYNPEYNEVFKRGKCGWYSDTPRKICHDYYKNGEQFNLNSSYDYCRLHIPIDENARFWFCNDRSINCETNRPRQSVFDVDYESFFVDKRDDEFVEAWLREFKPVLYDERKNYYLDIAENGLLIPVKIENGKSEQLNFMSGSDFSIFKYMCFIVVNRFYNDYEKSMAFDLARKPLFCCLFIFSFFEYLDEDVDVQKLLSFATALDGQVFVFSADKRLQNKDFTQIIY